MTTNGTSGQENEGSLSRCMRVRAWRAAATALSGDGYDRERHLPRLIGQIPGEAAGEPSAFRILARLRRALRAERSRGRAGHWSYDLNRHIALLQALRAERELRAISPLKTHAAPPREATPRGD